jgi:lipid II:glycine glycyltransferase (peptidoglycan interpeptide bridge formation enzyme)
LLINWVLSKQSKFDQSYVEIRTRFKGDLFKASKFKEFRGFKNHTLRLEENVEILKKNFDRTCVRQRINRAKKSNIFVTEVSSESGMRIFFKLHCLSRKKFGIPVQPYKFFKNMWEILYPRKMIGVLIATIETQPVSAILFLKYKQRIHAEYMGTDDGFLKYSPNILLFWIAIKKAKDEGYKFFDFGGSSIKNKNLINFKKRWGTIEEDIPHYYYPDVKGISANYEENILFHKLRDIYCKMPDKINRHLGSLIYRHLGG